MIPFLIVLLLLIAAFSIWKMNGGSPFGAPLESRRPASPSRPHFSGRIIEPRLSATRAPRPASPSRLRQNSRTAFGNGHAVTPPDAIGLACLAPISECRLGPDCLCVTPGSRRRTP